MTHIIYKSRIVSPKVEKPVQDKYKTTPELGGGYRVTDWLSFDTALLEYEQHLESLWPDGIECSPELLAKYKDGDEVVEGKDFKISRVGRCFGRYSAMVEIAVPTDAVEEGEDEATRIYAKFFAGEYVEGDPDMDKVLAIKEEWDRVYQANRSKGFSVAELEAHKHILSQYKLIKK